MRKTVPIVTVAAIVLAGIVVVALSPSCAKKETASPAASYPVKIETIDGVRTVLNPAFPKEGVVRYALLKELVVGGEGGGAASVLNRPQYLDVDAEGNIYVLDWGDVDFKVFGPDGRLLRTFGKKGQGPGEFDTPASFDIAADGRIVLLSGRQHQIITLDNTGTYLSSFRVDGYCMDLKVDTQNRIYYTQMLSPEPGGGEEFEIIQNRMALFKSDEMGKEKVPLGEYLHMTMMRKVQKVGEAMSSTSHTSRESYLTSWLVGPDDRVYIGYNKDYRLDVYDPDWRLLFRFGREFAPLRHPMYKPDGAHPEFYPAFSDWHKFFDDAGNLWLEQYVEEGVEDHVFDVFSPDGIYLKQVRAPEVLFLVRGDKAYSIVRNEDEFLVVKRFRMVPEPPFTQSAVSRSK
ncbi:MAG: 6-bladed beta-propeller [Candidatus Aminicenantes bacterium]|nr:6-bladed beta-propeller [Candidatus Aminicenantes bacterium]